MSAIDKARAAVDPLLQKFSASQDKEQDANALAVSSYLRGLNDAGAINRELLAALKFVAAEFNSGALRGSWLEGQVLAAIAEAEAA